MEIPSRLVEKALEEVSRLPGIGRKTALRLILHLLKQPESQASALANSLIDLREGIKYCSECHLISDTTDCTCRTMARDTTIVCVVEDTPDALAVRNTGQYNGMFHVLRGKISPMDGIGPESLQIDSLKQRLKSHPEIKEVILALSSTMEGDTTAFYITKVLSGLPVKITTIARGIPVGGELEYADELTLGRSISSRTDFTLNQ